MIRRKHGKHREAPELDITAFLNLMVVLVPFLLVSAVFSRITIMGLIAAFTAVANANPAEKADLLSASISVAMNTTAFGLMAGIPLLIFHAFLTSRTGDIVDSLEMASVKTLNIITSTTERKRDAYQGPPEITITNLSTENISEAALSGDFSEGVDIDKTEKPD